MNDQLLNITRLQINYFQQLDFIDIIALSQINKAWYEVCNNDLLRNIIYSKNDDIDIPRNFDIMPTLQVIYNQLSDILHEYHPKNSLPNWIIYEKFIINMIYKMLNEFIDMLTYDFEDYINNNDENIDSENTNDENTDSENTNSENSNNDDNDDKIISMSALIFAFPHYSTKVSLYDRYHYENEPYVNIYIPIDFIYYMGNTYEKIATENRKVKIANYASKRMSDAIHALLLVNN